MADWLPMKDAPRDGSPILVLTRPYKNEGYHHLRIRLFGNTAGDNEVSVHALCLGESPVTSETWEDSWLSLPDYGCEYSADAESEADFVGWMPCPDVSDAEVAALERQLFELREKLAIAQAALVVSNNTDRHRKWELGEAA